MLETYSYNNVSHTIDFCLYILIKLISAYYMLTIDNITTYCHNLKLRLFSITLLQKHSRSDIYESDPFRYSDTRMC